MERPGGRDLRRGRPRLVYTADYWHEWLGHGEFPDHPWRTYLQRSALTLKGLTYAPTGAMVAAATTTLPETPGGERNWDYRYAWIRDSTFMLWGLYTLGFDEEANDFFYFIRDVASETDDELQIMYGIGGEETLTEQMLLHLDGYEHARPVRVGNGAYDQKQHDVWGALLDSIYLHTKSRDGLAESTWQILVKQVDHAIAAWREPDRGIWEVRGSRGTSLLEGHVLGGVRPRRAARAPARGPRARRRWQPRPRTIHADICAHGVDERGVFCQHYDTDALDASCLLIPLVRFLPPDDARVVATVNAIAEELTVDGLVQRYKVEETDDGLVGEEGTFATCSFWLVSALAEIGEHDRARALCEKMLGYASPLRLYAEEIDASTGRHLGNFPQAFTHLALINAVMHVIRADHELAAAAAARDAPRGDRHAHDAEPAVTRCSDPEAVAARAAEVMAAAIDGARTVHGGAHVALSGRLARRAYALVGPQLPDWRDVHLWYGDERCVRARRRGVQPPPRHRAPRRARRDLAPGADPARLRRGGRGLRARRSPLTFDVAVNGMGPDGHTASLFPGFPQVHADGVCVAVHGSPKPPSERVTLTLPKLNASRRILLAVPAPTRRRCSRACSRGPIPRCRRRCWTASASRSSPTRRRSMADEVWLAAPRRDRVVADGQAHRAHRHPAHRQGPRGGERAARPPEDDRRSCSARRCRAPARRRSSRASSHGTERRPPRVGLRRVRGPDHAGDPRGSAGLVPVARRRPGGEGPGTWPPAATASSPRLRGAGATSRSSPMATSCACWPRAGSMRRSPSADACTSPRARSPCSA